MAERPNVKGGNKMKLYEDYDFYRTETHLVCAAVENTKVWPEGQKWWGKESEMPSAMRARLRESDEAGRTLIYINSV